jgi:glycosyltransferase involved in cell wall biosynthesis/SAM-dependent methyltransferase
VLDKPSADADAHAEPALRSKTSLAVLIVGMHRSGTSALGGMLNKLGVAVPEDQHPPDEHNARGYFEPERIIDFHEALLAKLGSPSNDPLPLSYDWVRSPVGRAAAVELADILDEEFGDSAMCLFKDPRMCRLMPVWTAALTNRGRDAVAILPCRHPLEVAGSLSAKAGLSRPYGLFMWLQHVLLGERFTRDMKRSFTLYDVLLSDWRAVVDKLQRELEVAWPRDLVRAGPEIDAFLSSELRHHQSPPALEPHDPLDELCARTWAALHRLNDAPYDVEAMAELDAVWAAFEAAVGVFGPLVVSYQRTEQRLRDEQIRLDQAARREILSRDAIITDLSRQVGEQADLAAAAMAAHDRAQAAGRAQMESLLQARRKDHENLHGLRLELDRREAEIGALSVSANAAHVGLHAALQRLDAIENSTSWRLTFPLRTRLVRNPALRRLIRGALKLGWWTVTLKLPAKLKARKRVLEAASEPVLETKIAPPAQVPAPPVTVAGPTKTAATRMVFVSGEAHTPGHLYRIHRPAEAARLLGADVTVIRIEDVRDHLDAIRKADIVFIWRAAWTEEVALLFEAARAGKAVVNFDVDDLMFEPDLAVPEIIDGIRSQDLSHAVVADHFDRMRRTLLAADYCSAPTTTLAHRMRRQLKPAFVLPNGFDDDVVERAREALYEQRAVRGDGLIRIGYATGSKTHQQDFAKAAVAIGRILREHPECRLVLFVKQGERVLDIDEFSDFFGLSDQIEWRDLVPIEQLPLELARFDINLAPLEAGNLFCEAKSELKFFEAALVDVPTIASPTEPYRLAMRHGQTGFLAETSEEWYAALKQLVEDPKLRAEIARNALWESLARYGSDRRAELMTSFIEQTLGGGRRAARAFELDLARAARPPAPPPFIPDHEVVFASDPGRRAQVTVIVPLYNYSRYVAEALDSVQAQTLQDLDLVVVNDCSTDDSEAVALQWLERNAARFNRALLIRNTKNAGLGFTRNVGFARADTAYVLPLDADNRLLPDCAERLLAAAKSEGAAFAFSLIRQFGDNDCMMGEFDYDPVRFVYANYIDAMALIRRPCWAAAGGYDHVRYGWEDYDLWCRFVERGFFGKQVNEILAEYRVHGNSMLRIETEQVRNKIRLLRDMERRHPWLTIDRKPIWGLQLPDDEPEPEAAPFASALDQRTDGEVQNARLDQILPMLRCPETGQPLKRDGEGLKTLDGTKSWPVLLGRPVMFDGLGEPRVFPAAHISNALPERAVDLIEGAKGPVLNLSAGGTPKRYDHVIELEVGVFGHTDVVADVHALPFDDGTFDLVVSMNAFEHYHTPRRAVEEIMRVLKPGGRVFIRTAFMQPLHEAPWHFYNCTRYGLERWFDQFETLDLQVANVFNPIHALSWQLSEAEVALRRELTARDAERFLDVTARELISLWREPDGRDHPVWRSFLDLPQAAQEQLAAGFEYLGRKPG